MAETDSTRHAHNFKDLTGQRFGKWTVTGEAEKKHGAVRWNCICDCGTVSVVDGLRLRNGTSHRCRACASTKHGLCKSPEYIIWAGMHSRCECPSDTNYPFYGAKGTSVCDEWKSFEVFYRDMGKRPTPKHTIERIDNSLGYSKDNCKWATMSEQRRNASHARLITFNGQTQCASDWAVQFGVNVQTFLSRLNRGVPMETALSTTKLQRNHARAPSVL